jgi:hypothetical protein
VPGSQRPTGCRCGVRGTCGISCKLRNFAEVVLPSGTFRPNIHEHPPGYLMTDEKPVAPAPRAPPIALCKPGHDLRGSGPGMSRDRNLLLIAQRDEKESTGFVKPGQMEHQTPKLFVLGFADRAIQQDAPVVPSSNSLASTVSLRTICQFRPS